MTERLSGELAFFLLAALVVAIATIFIRSKTKLVVLLWGSLISAMLANQKVIGTISSAVYQLVSALLSGIGQVLEEFKMTRQLGRFIENISTPGGLTIVIVIASFAVYYYWRNIEGDELQPVFAFIVLTIGLWPVLSADPAQNTMDNLYEWSISVINALPGSG